MIFNFHSGKTANKIKELIKAEILKTSQYFFEPIRDIKYSEIVIKDNRFFYNKGENTYLMFAYKQTYRTLHHNDLPRYHVCQCKTRNEYSGFTYASTMPVEIFCRDQNKTLEELQNLELCKNCVSASQKGLYAMVAKGKPWYDYVIDYANSKNELAQKTKSDGYVLLWKQISEAIRERAAYKCEQCDINLDQGRYYLEVHHIDYDKTNNKLKNLEALCVLCHATVDEKHLNNFKKDSIKVNSFINYYSEFVMKNNTFNYNKWIK